MKIKIVYTIILMFCTALNAMAQDFTLQGRVTDEDENPVELAVVSVLKQGKATMTSMKGDFYMSLKSEDSVVVKFSMIGYKTKTRILRHPKGKLTLQVKLYGDATVLDEVNVDGQKIQTGQNQELNSKNLQKMNTATGNNVEKLVQLQAGVSSHSELSSQYNVRGGAFNENSIYINGVEIYRPFLVRSGQQEGLSVINPDMVDKINFSTGGFAAKYGDKMSSALDITYRRPEHFEAKINASMLGAGAYIALGNKKISWSNSIRYKTNRYLLGSLQTEGEYRPDFMDYQTYLSYRPNKRWTIDFIGNINDNHYNFYPESRETKFGTAENVKSFKVYFDGQEKDLFRTWSGALDITRHITDNTSISLIASAFNTNEKEQYDIQGQYWLTQTDKNESLGVGTYFEHTRNYLKANTESAKLMLRHKNGIHNIEAGFTIKREHIEEKSTEYEMRDSSGYNIPNSDKDLYMIYSMKADNTIDATRTEAYVQDTWRFASAGEHTYFTLNYGVRMSHWNFNHETIVSPRLSLGIIPAFDHNMTLRFATGIYYQAPIFKELRDTSTVNGITVATLNRKIKSQRSIHFIAGMDYRFNLAGRKYIFSAEAYYKALSNLIPYSINNVNVVYYGTNDASGHAAGIDLKLYGDLVPGAESWISVSLMDTEMKLEGRKMPLPTDQKYVINLCFTDFFPGTDRWKMSLNLSYADGLPFSAPHQELQRNSFRAPAYKRADIGMSYRLLNNEKRNRKSIFKNIWLGVECFNLFGINNVNSYYWITDVNSNQYAVPNYLTGRMLSGNIQVEF